MSEFSVRRPVTVIMFNVGLIVLGLISADRIQMRLLPPIVTPEFSILTRYKGATPKEIEEKITTPIEKSVSTESGLYRVESYSEDGQSSVRLKFTSDINILETISNIRQKLDDLSFPEGVSRPKILRFNPNASPILRASLSLNEKSGMGQRELAEYLQDNILKKIESIDGVAVAILLGIPGEEIVIELNHLKAQFYGIDLTGLDSTIKGKNKDLPGGSIFYNGRSASVRLGQKLKSIEDVKNIIVKKEDGKKIYLKDIATVSRKQIPPSIRTHLQSKQGLILEIKKESEANTVDVVAKVRVLFEKFLKENEEIDGIILIDQGREIKSSIDNVISAVVNGGILAAIVIFIFLQSVGPTSIVALSIPMSLMITLILMYFTGVSFNLMSLGGLALGVGMLVDNSIVVLENIGRLKGEMDDPKQAVIWGTQKVAAPITSSTLTTIAVFGPLVFVEGMIGQLFRDISLTVVYSLTSSLFVALILIPTLSSFEFSSEEDNVSLKDQLLNPFIEALNKSAFAPIYLYPYFYVMGIIQVLQVLMILLSRCLYSLFSKIGSKSLIAISILFNHTLRPVMTILSQVIESTKTVYGKKLEDWLGVKKVPLTIILILFIFSVTILFFKGAELFPNDNVTRFNYTLTYPPGTPLNEVEENVTKIEKKLMVMTGVSNVTSIIGSVNSQTANILINLEELPPSYTASLEKIIIELLSDVPDLKYVKESESMISSERPLQIEIYHDKLEELPQIGLDALKALQSVDGVRDAELGLKSDVTEINVSFNQIKLDQYGAEISGYTGPINLLIMGKSAGHLTMEGKQVPMRLIGSDKDFDNISKLKYFSVKASDKPIVLSQVANIQQNQILGLIKHINRKRVVTLSSDIEKFDLSTVSANVSKKLDKLFSEKEIKWKIAGQDVERQRSQQSLIFAMLLSIFLIYILLASQFESFIQPTIILFAVPLCIVGVSFTLVLLQMNISALVFIGLIILAGISVNTSIVLVDTMNENIISGMDRKEAIIEASKNRLRPILMTALSTIIGLLPMAVSMGQGAAMRRPLAITVIGGLISSTILTLIVVPLIFDLISKKKALVGTN